MPKFNPLNTNNSPSINARAGINLFIFLRILRFMAEPKNVAANIIGKVPNPNSIIYAAPDNPEPVDIAPAIPT